MPVNAGFYEQVRLVAPEGTVVNCTAPSPVVGGWETQVAALRYHSQGTASGAARYDPGRDQRDDVPSRLRRHRPAHGAAFSYYETMAGGYGGRSTKDGPDAVQCHGQNTENAPIEEIEINYPLRIDRYER